MVGRLPCRVLSFPRPLIRMLKRPGPAAGRPVPAGPVVRLSDPSRAQWGLRTTVASCHSASEAASVAFSRLASVSVEGRLLSGGLVGVSYFVAEGVPEFEEALGQLVEAGGEGSVVEDAVEQGFLVDGQLDWSRSSDVLEGFDHFVGAWSHSQFPEQVFAAPPREPDVVGSPGSVDRDADVVEALGHWSIVRAARDGSGCAAGNPRVVDGAAVWCLTGRTGGRSPNALSPTKGVTQMRIALALKRAGLNSDLLHSLGFTSIGAAVSLWVRSGSVEDDKKKARAERLAIFVGLWPPTFFLLGKVLQDLEATPAQQVFRARGVDEDQLDATLRHEAAATATA